MGRVLRWSGGYRSVAGLASVDTAQMYTHARAGQFTHAGTLRRRGHRQRFRGAVTSCRLAEAGLKVLVLERGRRWTPETLPRKPSDPWVWDQARPEKRNGWLDFRLHRRLSVAQGAGVGGGSLIYANVQVSAPPAVFEQGWPAAITHDALAPYDARVERMLRPRPVPEAQRPLRSRLLEQAAGALGHGARFRPMDLAISFDDDGATSARPRSTRGIRGGGPTSTGASRAPASTAATATSDARSAPGTRSI